MTIRCLFLLGFLFLAQPVLAMDSDYLFSAAILGKTERVKSLLAKGVDVDAVTITGRTAMMAACFNGNERVVRLLLTYGADVNLADKMGITALMDAVVFGSEDLVKLLITAGANIDAFDKQNMSVIDKAKKTKYINIVKILEPLVTAVEEKTETDPSTKPDDTIEENKE
ncbi:MAG: ankyrin repeat domain-containing protein [Methylococcales bacterium]|nr:ankyrin repeat domain-containing protein [Methylococcales bacterium]